jgi:hypothetical protein
MGPIIPDYDGPLPAKRLKRLEEVSLAEEARESIRTAILDGSLRPNSERSAVWAPRPSIACISRVVLGFHQPIA